MINLINEFLTEVLHLVFLYSLFENFYWITNFRWKLRKSFYEADFSRCQRHFNWRRRTMSGIPVPNIMNSLLKQVRVKPLVCVDRAKVRRKTIRSRLKDACKGWWSKVTKISKNNIFQPLSLPKDNLTWYHYVRIKCDKLC